MTALTKQSLASIRSAREAFLERHLVADSVRPEIAASWQRSQLTQVSPERPTLEYEPTVEWHNRLYTAARPVLDHYADKLAGTRSSIVLADRHALVLGRWVGERDVNRQLDRGSVARGFVLSEESAGTNGLGTVLEVGRPLAVIGSEHFADIYGGLTCVGAPIRDPISRRMEGAVDIAVPAEETNALLLPMVREIAQEIEQRLYLGASAHELILLEAFLRSTQRARNPVVCLSSQTMICNAAATSLLGEAEHVLLWKQAAQIVSAREDRTAELHLRDGRVLPAYIKPIQDGESVVGIIIEIRPQPRSQLGRAVPIVVPRSLAGRSAAWRHVLQLADVAAAQRLPVLIAGEHGVGKLEIARYIHQQALKDEEFSVFDGALVAIGSARTWLSSLTQRLLDARGTIVVRNLQSLPASVGRSVAALIEHHDHQPGPRLIATLDVDSGEPTVQSRVVDAFAVLRIDISPLRERSEDVPDLLEELLRKHSGGALTRHIAPDALSMLVRYSWPGNVRQLENMIRYLVATGSGEIRVEDLPAEIKSGTRGRVLTRLEQAEIQQIENALAEVDGNKLQAARRLGISRSSLYRKLTAARWSLAQPIR